MIDSVEFWNPDTGSYQVSAPTIYLNQDAGLFVTCTNDGGTAEYMRVDANVFMPNGDAFYLSGMTKGYIQPGITEFWDEYLMWPCGFEGLYRADVVLFSGPPGAMSEIDRVSVDVAHVRLYGETGFIERRNMKLFAMVGLGCLGIYLWRRKR